MLVAALAFITGMFMMWSANASAAATGLITISPENPPAQNAGAGTNYTINFTCSAVLAEECGDNPTIRIPINVNPPLTEVPPLSDWNFNVTSSQDGLIESWELVGNEIVVHLNKENIQPGDSKTLNLRVAPPNGYTPDGTSWSMLPTYQSSEIPVTVAPNPAHGSAKASTKLAVSKNTRDGSSFYLRGSELTYNITARCNEGFPTGSLFFKDASLVDTLPSEVQFVSATPAPTSAPTPPATGGEVRWDFSNPGTMPPNCVENPGGTANYSITVLIPETVPDAAVIHNSVTLSGTPIGTNEKLSSTAQRDVTVLDQPPTEEPGVGLTKDSAGPLNVEGRGFRGTYPGHWIQPANPIPSTNQSSAEGRYTLNVRYNASQSFTTDLVDPLPCLDNKTGVRYESLPVSGHVNGWTGIPACTNPAFHTTAVRISAASMPDANAAGYAIELRKTDGTIVTVPITSMSGTTANFVIPPAHIGAIDAVRVPPSTKLMDASMTVHIFGYADQSANAGEILRDQAASTAYPAGSDNPAKTAKPWAEIYIEETQPQLAIRKTFGSYGSAAGGTTALNLVGDLSIPIGYLAPGPVVLADLLPTDMEWANPPASGTVNFTRRLNGSNSTIQGDVEYIRNYQGTGRDLIRISFDKSHFTQSGSYRLTPPSNFIRVSVPTGAATYNNTGNIFVSGSGQNTSPVCGSAVDNNTSDVSDFHSEDPRDLDGDGETTQNSCAYNANLTVPPLSGPAIGLTKRVWGPEGDGQIKGPGKVAETTNGGPGEYYLRWRNTGSENANNPVIYDILPHVGDTGIAQGQVNQARDSEFAVIFDEVSSVPEFVTVWYSQSYNPCRAEMFPTATTPPDNTPAGCDDDWSTTPPADPADVKSLKFVAEKNTVSGDAFDITIKFHLPEGEVNSIAWNSAATTASFSSGTMLLPAEPPKVGITAPADPVTPTLTTQVSSAQIAPGGKLSDTITIEGAGNLAGTAKWKLYGPVDPGAAASCDAVDWTGADLVDQGTVSFTGDGDYETDETQLDDIGCYGYEVTISSTGFSEDVTSPLGTENEVALVRGTEVPTVETQVSNPRVTVGNSVTDTITLAATGGFQGTASWTLYGPVDAADCDAADYADAPAADSGTVGFTGNGSVETDETELTDPGCYSYEVTVESPGFAGPVTHPAGSTNEIVEVRPKAAPTVSTQVSDERISPGDEVLDTITIGGTDGFGGVATWTLHGPVDVGYATSCEDVDWEGAPVIDQGSLEFTGNGDIDTPGTTLDENGCYGYEITISGDDFTGEVTHPLGSVNEVVLVKAPVGALNVTKKAGRKKVKIGSKVKYTIVVTNPGPGMVPGATLTDRPAKPMDFVRAATTRGTCGTGFPLNCQFGDLEAGAKVTVTVIAKPTVLGKTVNTAIVRSEDPEVPDDRDRDRIRGWIKLKLVKKATRKKVKPGQKFSYILKVRNPSRAVVRRAEVCDKPPAGIKVLSTHPKARLKNGSWCWKIARIAPRTTKTFRMKVRALRGARGMVVNRARVKAPDTTPDRDRARVWIRKPVLKKDAVTG